MGILLNYLVRCTELSFEFHYASRDAGINLLSTVSLAPASDSSDPAPSESLSRSESDSLFSVE